MKPDMCRCSCGQVEFKVESQPLVRLCCHCTICQKFNDAAYADIAIYDGKAIQDPEEGRIDYKSYKAKSPILRGKCSSCNDPILEKTISGGKFWIVPVSAFDEDNRLPEPTAHIYYETRIADIGDKYPKYNSGLKGNLVVGLHVLKAKFFRRKTT